LLRPNSAITWGDAMSMIEQRANLQGKVAAIVGGASGIGAAVTLALAGAGVDVAFCDIDAQALEPTRNAAQALSRRVLAVAADATGSQQLASFYSALGARFDRLDIVVNVVGGTRRRDFMEATPEQCAADIQRNYGYVIESVRHAVPLIRNGGRGGSIINFTTIEAHRGAAGFAVYAGAKAATTNFTRAIAVELGRERIRVNAVAPDTTPSEGNMKALPPELLARMANVPPAAVKASMDMYIPMKAQPAADDLANGVLFLASDLSAFVTGTTLHIDGGTLAAAGFVDWPFDDGYLPVPMDGTLSRLFRSA
jgi:NAD(P)-dependent dehydrogenase (short-subunit alcohol dehydrogenase family)